MHFCLPLLLRVQLGSKDTTDHDDTKKTRKALIFYKKMFLCTSILMLLSDQIIASAGIHKSLLRFHYMIVDPGKVDDGTAESSCTGNF